MRTSGGVPGIGVAVLRPLAVGVVAVGLGAALLAEPVPAGGGVLGYLLAAGLIVVGWRARGTAAARFGRANVVTLVRVVGTAWVLALALQAAWLEPTAMIMVAAAVIAGICLVLDGIDGRLARRYREQSSFGERFDIETDAGTTAVLAFGLWIVGVAGWWVLIIGAMRYLFLLAGMFVPALRGRLRVSLVRKAIGISQGIAMAVALFGAAVHTSVWWQLLPVVALAALVWSFGRDCVQLLRQL